VVLAGGDGTRLQELTRRISGDSGRNSSAHSLMAKAFSTTHENELLLSSAKIEPSLRWRVRMSVSIEVIWQMFATGAKSYNPQTEERPWRWHSVYGP
jgi:hypothetical protein